MTPDDIVAALDGAITETAAQYSEAMGFSRSRKLPLETVLRLLIGAEGGSLAKILHDAKIDATPSALSQRRAQIDPCVFYDLFRRFNAACEDKETCSGYKIVACDGTVLSQARCPDSPSFVCHETIPNGVNQQRITPLYDAVNRTFIDAVVQFEPEKDEIFALIEMLGRNSFNSDAPALVVADRGFESYNLLAHLQAKENCQFLIRIRGGAMREVAKLPNCEIDAQLNFELCTTQRKIDKELGRIHLSVPKKSKPGSKTSRTRWDFPSPFQMGLRVAKVRLASGELECLATSLPSSYSLDDLRSLYFLRTKCELGFRDLKYSVGMINLTAKNDMMVRQEIYSSLVTFNFASRISREVVVRQPKDGIYAYQVNFKMAVMLCREFLRTPGANLDELMRQIARYTVPIRPGRQDERNLKVKGWGGFVYRVAA